MSIQYLSSEAENIIVPTAKVAIEEFMKQNKYTNSNKYLKYESVLNHIVDLNDGNRFRALHRYRRAMLDVLVMLGKPGIEKFLPETSSETLSESIRMVAEFFINITSEPECKLEYDHFLMRYPGHADVGAFSDIAMDYIGIEKVKDIVKEESLSEKDERILLADF
jgi:hypothetical protein